MKYTLKVAQTALLTQKASETLVTSGIYSILSLVGFYKLCNRNGTEGICCL